MTRSATVTGMAAGAGPSHASGGHVDIAILGAGFAGLCMAIKLQAAGRHDFLVFEKAARLGGTWRDNTYPGCACDVPSHLYSYSFAQNPRWSRIYAPQPEILAYLENVATRHDQRSQRSPDCSWATYCDVGSLPNHFSMICSSTAW